MYILSRCSYANDLVYIVPYPEKNEFSMFFAALFWGWNFNIAVVTGIRDIQHNTSTRQIGFRIGKKRKFMKALTSVASYSRKFLIPVLVH